MTFKLYPKPILKPGGTTYARFSLFDADVNPGSDIDICVIQGATLIGSSGSGTSAEEVNFIFSSRSASPISLTVVRVSRLKIEGVNTVMFSL